MRVWHKSCTALCYNSAGTRPSRIVVVRDPSGRRKDDCFFSTELYLSAKAILELFAMRWPLEEFHKSEKTGCRVEECQLRDTDRLEPLIGLLSVLAVYLLQLKYVAREDPDRPARHLFGDEVVAVLAAYHPHFRLDLGVTEFWRGIGRLGGHPGRKCDGPLGWLRAWRGRQSFQWIMLGASLPPPKAAEKCG